MLARRRLARGDSSSGAGVSSATEVIVP
jgi:hypothetical protein